MTFLAALVLAATVVLGAATAVADTPPTVTIDAPTDAAYTTAHVSGTVNPQGGPSEVSWHFEYSTDPEAGSWEYAFSASGSISGAAAEGTSPIVVEGPLEGLAPDTTYSVRLVAENEGGANQVATGAPYPTFTTDPVAPPTVSIDPVGAVSATSAELSGEVDPGGSDEAFGSSWEFRCMPECPTFLGGFVPGDGASHDVSKTATDLLPNTEYEVELVATNAGGPTSSDKISFTTDPTAPQATTIPAFALEGGTEALLGGRVNPTSQPTTYWFEYGPDPDYGASLPAGRDASAGSGSATAVVSQRLTGLEPQTTYHYRVVAENATGTTPGLDQTFTTRALPAEPPQENCANASLRALQHAEDAADCRAWEKVSPLQKNNVDAGGTEFVWSTTQSSPAGDAVAYFANGAFAGSASAQTATAYLARRDAGGWSNKGFLPPAIVTVNSVFAANKAALSNFLSEDLSRAIVITSAPLTPDTPTTPAKQRNLYVEDIAAGTHELVTTGEQRGAPEEFPQAPVAVGVTPDFRHVLFQSQYALTPDAPTDLMFPNVNLYEWDADDPGTLRLVYLPNDELAPEGTRPGGWDTTSGSFDNVLSDDGSRVFFGATIAGSSDLFMREDGTETTEIAKSSRYVTARADGSAVLFLEGDVQRGILRRYDVDSETATTLSPDAEPADGTSSLVDGVVGASPDLSVVYFTAEGQLVPGQGRTGAGLSNLYVNDHGTVRYITTLGGSGVQLAEEESLGSLDGYPSGPVAQRAVSADGERVAFASAAQLTAYDNGGRVELYVYDTESGELTCPSCRADGSPAQGDALIHPTIGGHLSFVSLAIQSFRNFSADGTRFFFQTTDGLAPADSNGASDVYELEDGEVRLLTSGAGDSPQGHLFMGASASGDDVFFTTRNRVVAEDVDDLSDVYDARVGGGLIAQNVVPTGPASCEGQQCRGPASSPLASTPPTSREVRGSKNATPHKHKKKKHKKHKTKKHRKHKQNKNGGGKNR